MRIAAVICNIVMFAFLCLVLRTDGLPTQAAYIVFTLWSLMTLILSAVVLSRRGMSTTMRTLAIICNIVYLAHTCWAFVDQYPHPEEEGFIPFVVMMVLTPILTLLVLFRSRAGGGWLGLRMKRKPADPAMKNDA